MDKKHLGSMVRTGKQSLSSIIECESLKGGFT